MGQSARKSTKKPAKQPNGPARLRGVEADLGKAHEEIRRLRAEVNATDRMREHLVGRNAELIRIVSLRENTILELEASLRVSNGQLDIARAELSKAKWERGAAISERDNAISDLAEARAAAAHGDKISNLREFRRECAEDDIAIRDRAIVDQSLRIAQLTAWKRERQRGDEDEAILETPRRQTHDTFAYANAD